MFGNDFVYKFEQLLVLDFAIQEIEIVLVLDVVEHIDSVDIGLAHYRI